MKIDVVRPQELSTGAIARWAALQACSPEFDSPFLSPYWARAVAHAQGERSSLKTLILSDDAGGEPWGFFAARTGPFTAMPVGAPMNDCQAVVAEPGREIDPVRLVQALGVGRLDFNHMLASQSAFIGHAQGVDGSWIIDVGQGYAAYEASKKAEGVSALKETDRKRRKVEREVGPITFQAFSRSQVDFDQLVKWKREAWKATSQTDIFSVAWTQSLVNDLFASRDPDFGGVLFTLHFGDRLVAAQFDLRGRHTVHSWLIGHDAAMERYSPGMILFQAILRWMDETPYSRLDLGCGDYRFKREFANRQVGVAHGFVGSGSPASLLRQAAYGLRRAAESLPLGGVSELPGKAMRRLDLIRGLR